MRSLDGAEGLEVGPVALIDRFVDAEASLQVGILLPSASLAPPPRTSLYLARGVLRGGARGEAHVRQHHDSVAAQVQIGFDGVGAYFGGGTESGHGVLGVLSLVTPVSDTLGRGGVSIRAALPPLEGRSRRFFPSR